MYETVKTGYLFHVLLHHDLKGMVLPRKEFILVTALRPGSRRDYVKKKVTYMSLESEKQKECVNRYVL